MDWQAPNLLNHIFKTPYTGDGSSLGSFLGGYIAGNQNFGDRAKQQAAGGTNVPGWFQTFAKSAQQGLQGQPGGGFQAPKTAPNSSPTPNANPAAASKAALQQWLQATNGNVDKILST